MVLNATFNNISVISAAINFIGGRNREKNTELPQVTDKLDHRYDITEILLKVALNAINQTSPERD
jgi:hypothetical protein